MGLFSTLKKGVKTRIDTKVADLNERIEKPEIWREKERARKYEADAWRIRELERESRIAKLEASKSRSQASMKRSSGGSMGPTFGSIFDMGPGSGGGGNLFDLGGGTGSGKGAPLFDTGMGGGGLFDMSAGGSHKPKKKRTKSRKGNGNGIHIHYHK